MSIGTKKPNDSDFKHKVKNFYFHLQQQFTKIIFKKLEKSKVKTKKCLWKNKIKS